MQQMANCRIENRESTGKKTPWKDVHRTWMVLLFLLASAFRNMEAQGLCEPDKFGNCPTLANQGKCVTGIDESRPAAWVVQRCPLSCQENACMNPCVDKYSKCSRKAAEGKCFLEPTFMIENCRKTCQMYPCKVRNKPFAANDRLAGHATDVDTKKFAMHFMRDKAAGRSFYRRDPSLGTCIVPHQKVRSTPWLYASSIGLGIEGGGTNEVVDFAIEQATGTAILKGINVIDTSIVARNQRSEMSIGRVLRTLSLLNISRPSLFISSKAGFIPGNPFHDGFVKWSEQLRRKNLDAAAFVGNYCIAPSCLQKSLEMSLSNLGVSTLDALFLDTPAEAMLGSVARTDFFSRIKGAFLFLEEKRKQGLIQTYGISVNDCLFRHPQDPLHLQLQDLVNIAESAGGSNHGFRYVQIPVSAGVPSSWTALHQRIDGIDGRTFTAPEAAARLRLGVLGKDPLIQGGLVYNATIFQIMKELNPLIVDESSFAKELTNFARSTPYITSSLTGAVDLPAVTKQLELVQEAGWSSKLLGIVQNQLEHALR